MDDGSDYITQGYYVTYEKFKIPHYLLRHGHVCIHAGDGFLARCRPENKPYVGV